MYNVSLKGVHSSLLLDIRFDLRVRNAECIINCLKRHLYYNVWHETTANAKTFSHFRMLLFSKSCYVWFLKKHRVRVQMILFAWYTSSSLYTFYLIYRTSIFSLCEILLKYVTENRWIEKYNQTLRCPPLFKEEFSP